MAGSFVTGLEANGRDCFHWVVVGTSYWTETAGSSLSLYHLAASVFSILVGNWFDFEAPFLGKFEFRYVKELLCLHNREKELVMSLIQ